MPNKGSNYEPLSRAMATAMRKVFRFLWRHRKLIIRFIFYVVGLINQHRDNG